MAWTGWVNGMPGCSLALGTADRCGWLVDSEACWLLSCAHLLPSSPPQVVVNQANYMGAMLFICYMAAAAYYFYVRATKTLDIGYVW